VRSPDQIGISWEENQLLMQQLREKAALENRRQHNIFEVGDKVVHPKFSNMNIYEICEIKGDLFTVFYDRKSHSFKSDVRHATDEEIKAGKRLEVS
jgi:hypothetical protein